MAETKQKFVPIIIEGLQKGTVTLHLRVFGSNRNYSASYEPELHDMQHHEHLVLAPCPFCGNKQAELTNTHTPSYWVECACGVQKSPQSSINYPKTLRSIPQVIQYHRRAMQLAVFEWNYRPIDKKTVRTMLAIQENLERERGKRPILRF